MKLVLVSLALMTIGSTFAEDPIKGTAPAPVVHPLISKIGLGSCSNQNKPQPVLDRVVAWKPDLFVYLGDNIYGDTKDMKELAFKYGVLGRRPEFQRLEKTCPLIATWDDHDYGWNDAGSEYEFKAESKEVFLDFWREPDPSSRREHEGIYTSYLFGDKEGARRLQIILLDTRTFRSPLTRNPNRGEDGPFKNAYRPEDDPQRTLLGEAQWKWLEEELKRPADFRIIGTSIQFGHEYNGWESWTNLPLEQKKMTDLIARTKASGVVFISGDVHWAELSKFPVEGGYPIYDLTASGINQEWDKIEDNRYRVGHFCREHHYGRIEIDWEKEDPVLSFSVEDVAGKERLRHRVPLSEISW